MDNELERLQSLNRYEIMDTPDEVYFDDFVKLVALICETPVALVSFIDDKRQWYKAKYGIDKKEEPIENTICQFTIQEDDIMEIGDTLNDKRLDNNPHVHTENGVRFYIGISLKSEDGFNIGTVCAVDVKPKQLGENQKNALRIISQQIVNHLNTRIRNKELTSELRSVLEDKIEQANQQIKTQEVAYKRLLIAISKANAVIEFSTKGIILGLNILFEDLLGYAKLDLIGNQISMLLDGGESDKSIDFWEDLNKGVFKTGKYKLIHKNGSPVWVQASFNPLSNINGDVIKVTLIAQNISQEIQMQKDLENSKKNAEELNIQKDMFIANMSHEIRTPINSIIGFTDLLLDIEKSPQKFSYLQSIKTAGDSLLFLVNDILDLSKIEVGNFQIDSNKFHLISAIENVFSILNLKASAKNIIFEYHIDSSVNVHLIGDKNRLMQILLNLLGNAIKFTYNGTVSLWVSKGEDNQGIQKVFFEIQDTGIGIEPDKLDSIFDRFVQADSNTSKNFGGTGLGLNICKQLIEKHGGEITVKSIPNQGSIFTFWIPFEVSDIPVVEEKKRKKEINIKSLKGRILVCEDNEMNQNLIHALFRLTSFEYDIANNGEQALEFLKKKSYDLILMDLQMPIKDGYQTTLEIREVLHLNIPIIALTAHSLVKEKSRCIKTGMNDYLSKPFVKEELLEKMIYWIEENKEKQSDKSNSLDLSQLEELSGGDKKFQLQMLDMFLTQSKMCYSQIQNFYDQGNLIEASKIAHKIKSSMGILNADLSLVTTIESLLNKNKKSKGLNQMIKKLEHQLQSIYVQIQKLKSEDYFE